MEGIMESVDRKDNVEGAVEKEYGLFLDSLDLVLSELKKELTTSIAQNTLKDSDFDAELYAYVIMYEMRYNTSCLHLMFENRCKFDTDREVLEYMFERWCLSDSNITQSLTDFAESGEYFK